MTIKPGAFCLYPDACKAQGIGRSRGKRGKPTELCKSCENRRRQYFKNNATGAGRLTKKQLDVWSYIYHKPRTPLKDIAAHFDISIQSAYHFIRKLHQLGAIKHTKWHHMDIIALPLDDLQPAGIADEPHYRDNAVEHVRRWRNKKKRLEQKEQEVNSQILLP